MGLPKSGFGIATLLRSASGTWLSITTGLERARGVVGRLACRWLLLLWLAGHRTSATSLIGTLLVLVIVILKAHFGNVDSEDESMR